MSIGFAFVTLFSAVALVTAQQGLHQMPLTPLCSDAESTHSFKNVTTRVVIDVGTLLEEIPPKMGSARILFVAEGCRFLNGVLLTVPKVSPNNTQKACRASIVIRRSEFLGVPLILQGDGLENDLNVSTSCHFVLQHNFFGFGSGLQVRGIALTSSMSIQHANNLNTIVVSHSSVHSTANITFDKLSLNGQGASLTVKNITHEGGQFDISATTLQRGALVEVSQLRGMEWVALSTLHVDTGSSVVVDELTSPEVTLKVVNSVFGNYSRFVLAGSLLRSTILSGTHFNNSSASITDTQIHSGSAQHAISLGNTVFTGLWAACCISSVNASTENPDGTTIMLTSTVLRKIKGTTKRCCGGNRRSATYQYSSLLFDQKATFSIINSTLWSHSVTLSNYGFTNRLGSCCHDVRYYYEAGFLNALIVFQNVSFNKPFMLFPNNSTVVIGRNTTWSGESRLDSFPTFGIKTSILYGSSASSPLNGRYIDALSFPNSTVESVEAAIEGILVEQKEGSPGGCVFNRQDLAAVVSGPNHDQQHKRSTTPTVSLSHSLSNDDFSATPSKSSAMVMVPPLKSRSPSKTDTFIFAGGVFPSLTGTIKMDVGGAGLNTHTTTMSLQVVSVTPHTQETPARRRKVDIIASALLPGNEVAATVVLSSAGASAALASTLGSGGGGVLVVAGSSLRMIECGLAADDPRPARFELPLQLEIGEGPMRFFTGTVLVHSILHAIFFLLPICMRGNASNKFVKILAAVFCGMHPFFTPAVLGACSTVLFNHDDTLSLALATVSALAMISIHVLVVVAVHRGPQHGIVCRPAIVRGMNVKHEFTVDNTSHDECDEETLNEESPAATSPNCGRCPLSGEATKDILLTLFDGCRHFEKPLHRHYASVETTLFSIIATISGSRPQHTCARAAHTMGVIGFVHLVYVVGVRPFRTRLDAFFFNHQQLSSAHTLSGCRHCSRKYRGCRQPNTTRVDREINECLPVVDLCARFRAARCPGLLGAPRESASTPPD